MADIAKIKLPNGTTYNIKDSGALPLTGGTVTGPVSFQDSTSMDEATIGDLIVNGGASFTNNIQANTINGVTVGSSPKFTDTNYYHTTGSWSGLTYTATANGGAGALAFTIPTGTAATNVAVGNHTHTITLASDSGTSAITLASATKYKLTAGGNSVVFTMPTIPTGTVTSVAASNATNGGLTISGSPVTGSGTITIGHSNVLSAAQTTQAVYPIKIDKNGHISAYGTAVTSMPASDVYAWAKAATKPSYTASEVGALASNTTYVSAITTTSGTHSTISSASGAVSFKVPTKTSHLTNDSNFVVGPIEAITTEELDTVLVGGTINRAAGVEF